MDKKAFAEELKAKMTEKGISRYKLAKELNVELVTPYYWITGKSYPSDRSLYLLNQFLGTNFPLKNDNIEEIMLIGIALRNYRRSRGILVEDIMEALGLARSTVNSWESGAKVPTVRNLIKLADYYGCTLDELVGREQK